MWWEQIAVGGGLEPESSEGGRDRAGVWAQKGGRQLHGGGCSDGRGQGPGCREAGTVPLPAKFRPTARPLCPRGASEQWGSVMVSGSVQVGLVPAGP